MTQGMYQMTEAELRRINLEEWMRGCKKIILQHGKRPYFLTVTRRGNLILTSADAESNPTPISDVTGGGIHTFPST
jgi:hemin uptake protein HemP